MPMSTWANIGMDRTHYFDILLYICGELNSNAMIFAAGCRKNLTDKQLC